MEVASFIASGIVIGCIVSAIVICIWVALGNIDILLKNSEDWEDGE